MQFSRLWVMAFLTFAGCGPTPVESNVAEIKVNSGASESGVVFGPPAALKKSSSEAKKNYALPPKKSVMNSYSDQFSLNETKINIQSNNIHVQTAKVGAHSAVISAQSSAAKPHSDAIDEQSVIDSLTNDSQDTQKIISNRQLPVASKNGHKVSKIDALSAAEKSKECTRATLYETPAPGYCSCDFDEFEQRECTFRESF